MSCSRLAEWLATSPVMPAVIRFTSLSPGASTPNVNCVSLPIAPIGVIEVRPVELMAIRQKTKTSARATTRQPIVDAEETLGHPCDERADQRDADQRDPQRQLDVPQHVGFFPSALPRPVSPLVSFASAAQRILRLAEERQQRRGGHHRHAAPQRPERDLAKADRALAALGTMSPRWIMIGASTA